MKKISIKKVFGAVAAVAALFTLGSCGGDNTGEKVNLVIGVQQNSGNNYNSMCNFLDSLKDDLNFTYKTSLIASRNNDENLTTLQTEILAGAQGIITMVDLDEANTKKLFEDLDENDVYYAGYMTDFANVQGSQDIMGNKHMLGASTDGGSGVERGSYLFNQIVNTTKRKVVFARFPLYAYPVAADAIAEFKRLAEEYNTTHNDKFTYYTDQDGSDEFEVGFTMGVVPDGTVQNWASAGVEAVVAVNSLGKRLVTPVKSYGSNMSIYQLGWDDSIISEFGENGTIKTLCQTQAETILYPLVRVLNAVRGNSYSDEPTTIAQKILTCNYTYLSTAQDLADGRLNSMNFSTDHSISHSLISAADAKNLLAGQPDASFAKLVETLNSWDSDYVLRRQ